VTPESKAVLGESVSWCTHDGHLVTTGQ